MDLKSKNAVFLDRDGVINRERENDYVKNISEFIFIDGVLEAMPILALKFKYIFIITNQRGVGRGCMSLADLQEIHTYMVKEIALKNGRVTHIYFCTDTDAVSVNRKPNIGMAYQAKRDYPEISFNDSVLVGNSLSDMEFGNKLDMNTVLVGNKYEKGHNIYSNIDAYFPNLYEFALSL